MTTSAAQCASEWSETYRCPGHSTETVRGYCNDCDKAVCWVCVMEVCTSQGHDVKNLDSVLSEKKQDLWQFCNEVENGKLVYLEDKLQSTRTKTEQNEIELAMALSQVEHAGKTIVDNVKQTIQDIKDILKMTHDENSKVLTEMTKSTETCLSEAKNLLQSVKEKLQANHGPEIIELERTIQSISFKLDKCLSTPVPQKTLPRFNHGQIDKVTLDKMVGELSSCENDTTSPIPAITYQYREFAQELRTKVVSSNAIINVCPTDADKAWIITKSDNVLLLVDSYGRELSRKHVDFPPFDIAVSVQNQVFLQSFCDKRVIQISMESDTEHADRAVSTLFHTGELHPTCIALAQLPAALLWVGLVDSFSFSTDSSSKRLIACFTMDGKPSIELQYDTKGKQVFTIPRHLAISNVNLNIATINQVKETAAEIIITDQNGLLVTKFSRIPAGIPFLKKTIHPYDIAFNFLGDLIFSDIVSNSVIALSKTYDTVLATYPCSVSPKIACFPNWNLCLGNDKGVITIVDYLEKHQTEKT